jgi:hypothetical protein
VSASTTARKRVQYHRETHARAQSVAFCSTPLEAAQLTISRQFSAQRRLTRDAQGKVMLRTTSHELLVEAAALISATRVRIARSARLLAKLARPGSREDAEAQPSSRHGRHSTHPPSAPPQ